MAVMEVLGEAAPGEDPGAFECAACALRNMVVAGPEQFSEYMDLVVPRLLEIDPAAAGPAARPVEEVLQTLFDSVDPENCVVCLLKLPPHGSTAGPGLLTAIKMLNRAVVRLGEGEHLKVYVPPLFPGLLAAFASNSADVRKAVVFIIVDMYLLLGNWLQSFLEPLSTSQRRLLTIYINRAVKMKEGREGDLPPLSAAA